MYLNCLDCFFLPDSLLVFLKGTCTSFFWAGANLSLITKFNGLVSTVVVTVFSAALVKIQLYLGHHTLLLVELHSVFHQDNAQSVSFEHLNLKVIVYIGNVNRK